MNILILSFSDARGGAAKAASNQVKLLRKIPCKYNIKFVVAEKTDISHNSLGPNKLQYLSHLFLRCFSHLLGKLECSRNNVSKKSLNIFSSSHILKNIFLFDYDVVHFHWMNNDTISIEKLGEFILKNKKKIVITLHDDWFFCGSEHYSLNSNRYQIGYEENNDSFGGIDISKWVYLRKKKFKHLFENENVIFTSPSRWHTNKAKSSSLLTKCNVQYVPNVIDTNTFFPFDKNTSKEKLGFPDDEFIIAFGAIDGKKNPLKGFDLLHTVIQNLANNSYIKKHNKKISFAIFGGNKKFIDFLFDFKAYHLGKISSPSTLAKVYSACDLTVVPSRIESFGQVAAESLSCETPVVCFNNSGVSEIVSQGGGIAVPAFDTNLMTEAIIELIMKTKEERKNIGAIGRHSIISRYSQNVVSQYWEDIYNL